MKKFSGVVVKGENKSKKLGFPSANIVLSKPMASGVYLGKAYVDFLSYSSIFFIKRSQDMLEAHLLEFDGNLYGKRIEVEIIKKIRNTIDFKNCQELKKQVRLDIKKALVEKQKCLQGL